MSPIQVSRWKEKVKGQAHLYKLGKGGISAYMSN